MWFEQMAVRDRLQKDLMILRSREIRLKDIVRLTKKSYFDKLTESD